MPDISLPERIVAGAVLSRESQFNTGIGYRLGVRPHMRTAHDEGNDLCGGLESGGD